MNAATTYRKQSRGQFQAKRFFWGFNQATNLLQPAQNNRPCSEHKREATIFQVGDLLPFQVRKMTERGKDCKAWNNTKKRVANSYHDRVFKVGLVFLYVWAICSHDTWKEVQTVLGMTNESAHDMLHVRTHQKWPQYWKRSERLPCAYLKKRSAVNGETTRRSHMFKSFFRRMENSRRPYLSLLAENINVPLADVFLDSVRVAFECEWLAQEHKHEHNRQTCRFSFSFVRNQCGNAIIQIKWLEHIPMVM